MYPAIKEHLSVVPQCKLEERATAHVHPWYELQQPTRGAYTTSSLHPKIVWGNLAVESKFCQGYITGVHVSALLPTS